MKNTTTSRYFKFLPIYIIKKIEAHKYSFKDLPHYNQKLITDTCLIFTSLKSEAQLELTREISKLKEPPQEFINIDRQFSPLLAIPAELMLLITQNFSTNSTEQRALRLTNKQLHTFFQPKKLQDILTQLLWNVVAGEQSAVRDMLRSCPNLLLIRGAVTDYSGRTFTNITVFEYAVWALDVRYMCPMMLDIIPQDKSGEVIRKGLLQQFKNMMRSGLTYTLNGRTYNEKHYDFSLLINAYKNYISKLTSNYPFSSAEYWIRVIGSLQFETVAHVAQHYCDKKVPFHTIPNFDANNFNRTLTYYDCETKAIKTWWTRGVAFPNQELGTKYAIGSERVTAMSVNRYPNWWHHSTQRAQIDLLALTALFKARTEVDLPRLESRLHQHLQDADWAPGTKWFTII